MKDVPIYTVELAFDDLPFVLEPNEKVLQIRSNTWVWQRDRIVNKMIQTLPKEFNNIALVDADIFFHDENWWKDAEKMLKGCVVGQLWENCHHNHSSMTTDRGISNRDIGIVHTGYAWAARRDFLEEFGLFDRSVVGGNDVFMTAAYCGWARHPHFSYYTPEFLDYFYNWANRIIRVTKGDVGHLTTDITHMYHGPKQDRNYIGRIAFMKDYDPTTDVRESESGAWEWATDKPELHQGIKDYMQSRIKG